MPKHFNKGITAVKIIVILVAVAVVAFGAALALNYWWQPKEGDFDTPEAKLPEKEPSGEEPEDETAGWQTYRNEELGFEIKCPKEFLSNIREERLEPDGEWRYTGDRCSDFLITEYINSLKLGEGVRFGLFNVEYEGKPMWWNDNTDERELIRWTVFKNSQNLSIEQIISGSDFLTRHPECNYLNFKEDWAPGCLLKARIRDTQEVEINGITGFQGSGGCPGWDSCSKEIYLAYQDKVFHFELINLKKNYDVKCCNIDDVYEPCCCFHKGFEDVFNNILSSLKMID